MRRQRVKTETTEQHSKEGVKKGKEEEGRKKIGDNENNLSRHSLE